METCDGDRPARIDTVDWGASAGITSRLHLSRLKGDT